MAAAIEFGLDAETREFFMAGFQLLAEALSKLPGAAKSEAPAVRKKALEAKGAEDGGWFRKKEFCEMYRIGGTTLARLVEMGEVIKHPMSPRNPRYKWADGCGPQGAST